MSDNIKKGGISVETHHIFPIIKKWLYSEKDIFLREIVSNASDAVTKLKRLESLGIREATDEDYRITVKLDSDAGTLTVSDNGIGMTEEELDKYICSIALSGAVDFIQKYENESSEGAKNGIIGHFGLGFYSAFMVSDSVEIETKSYTDAPAVHWVCSESGEYELSAGDRKERGTSVIMHISESESEYLSKSKIRAILEKYCSFMPVEIYFEDADDEPKADAEPINDTFPLWQKAPSEATDEVFMQFSFPRLLRLYWFSPSLVFFQGTMASADFCAFSTVFIVLPWLRLSARPAQTSPGTTRFFPSIYLPHLSRMIPCT